MPILCSSLQLYIYVGDLIEETDLIFIVEEKLCV
jgi:hypothetical protein